MEWVHVVEDSSRSRIITRASNIDPLNIHGLLGKLLHADLYLTPDGPDPVSYIHLTLPTICSG